MNGRSRLTTLVVDAHPDDEVLGAAIWMHRRSRSPIHILHITDGSPRDMQDARRQGFASRSSYSSARRRELTQALQLIPIPPERCTRLSFPDKEAYLHLPALIDETEA